MVRFSDAMGQIGVQAGEGVSHHRPTSEGNTLHTHAEGATRSLPVAHEELRAFVASLRNLGPDGTVGYRRVLEICEPIVDNLEALRMEKTRAWFTLSEAREQTGRSPGYFENPQVSLEGKSRLQFWSDQGLAVQAGPNDRGVWLLHASVIGVEPVQTQAEIAEDPEEESAEDVAAVFTRDL